MCEYCSMSDLNDYGYQFSQKDIISYDTYMNDLTMNVCIRKQHEKNPVILIESDDISNDGGAFAIPINHCPMCGRKL